MGFIAKVVHAAKPWKPYFGAGSYTAAAFECFFKGEQPETFRVNLYNQIDGQEKLTYSEDVNSILFNIMDGRYGGGGISVSPISVMNDDLLVIVYFNKVMQFKNTLTCAYEQLINCGLNAYNPDWTYVRGRKVVLENLNYIPGAMKDPQNPKLELLNQQFQVDGEGMTFKEKVTMEVIPRAFELIVDFDQLMD